MHSDISPVCQGTLVLTITGLFTPSFCKVLKMFRHAASTEELNYILEFIVPNQCNFENFLDNHWTSERLFQGELFIVIKVIEINSFGAVNKMTALFLRTGELIIWAEKKLV